MGMLRCNLHNSYIYSNFAGQSLRQYDSDSDLLTIEVDFIYFLITLEYGNYYQ